MIGVKRSKQALVVPPQPCAPTLGTATPLPSQSLSKGGKDPVRRTRHSAESVGNVFPRGSIREGFPEEGRPGTAVLPLPQRAAPACAYLLTQI